MSRSIFATGMQRSGTTLLERLLHAPPATAMLSQPFPWVFTLAKRAFLEHRGLAAEAYPLGHLFGERRYTPTDLRAFLANWTPSVDALREVFAGMASNSGQYTRFSATAIEAALSRRDTASFAGLVASLYQELASLPGTCSIGGKEVLCEEFIPALLAHGFGVALIVRDPRDVLASLNHGRGREHAGKLKPTVMNVRNWRKSVAFALGLEGSNRFGWLRYEDLVHDPTASIGRLAGILELPETVLAESAGAGADPRGSHWSGNSSFVSHRGVDAQSVGIHRSALPAGVAEFVEALCWPELRALGYEMTLDREAARERVCGFRDPYPLERPELAHYLTSATLGEEVERLDLLAATESSSSEPYFLLPGVHRRLSTGVASPTRAGAP